MDGGASCPPHLPAPASPCQVSSACHPWHGLRPMAHVVLHRKCCTAEMKLVRHYFECPSSQAQGLARLLDSVQEGSCTAVLVWHFAVERPALCWSIVNLMRCLMCHCGAGQLSARSFIRWLPSGQPAWLDKALQQPWAVLKQLYPAGDLPPALNCPSLECTYASNEMCHLPWSSQAYQPNRCICCCQSAVVGCGW